MGLELSVKGLPKRMNKMNPDKMSSADRHHIVSAPRCLRRVARERSVCSSIGTSTRGTDYSL